MKKYTYLFLILILSSCSFYRYDKCFVYRIDRNGYKEYACMKNDVYKDLKSKGKTEEQIINVSKLYYKDLLDKADYLKDRWYDTGEKEHWKKYNQFFDKIYDGCYKEYPNLFYYSSIKRNKKLNKYCITIWKEAEKQQNENYKREYRNKKQEEKMMEENVKKINDCRKKTNNEYDFYICMIKNNPENYCKEKSSDINRQIACTSYCLEKNPNNEYEAYACLGEEENYKYCKNKTSDNYDYQLCINKKEIYKTCKNKTSNEYEFYTCLGKNKFYKECKNHTTNNLDFHNCINRENFREYCITSNHTEYDIYACLGKEKLYEQCKKQNENKTDKYDFYTCMNDEEGLQIYCDTILGNSTCQLKKTIKNIKNQCMQTNVYKHCMQKNCENLARSTGYNYYDCVND